MSEQREQDNRVLVETKAAHDRLHRATRERLRGMTRNRLYELIPRAIAGRWRLCIPPQPDDDDMIVFELINEAIDGREALRILDEYAVAVRGYRELPTRPQGGDSRPDVVGWDYRRKEAVRKLDETRAALDALIVARGAKPL